MAAQQSATGSDRTEAELSPEARSALGALAERIRELEANLAALEAKNAELAKLADQDSLMPMANRRAFLTAVSRQLSHGKRHNEESSLLYIDLDHMKQINDRFGHAAGDATLIHVAHILVAHVRNEDVVGRLGGDEFGVLLIGTGQAAAEEKGATLASALVNTPLIWNNIAINVTAAIGAYAIRDATDAETAIEAADIAMYRVKHTDRLTRELSDTVPKS